MTATLLLTEADQDRLLLDIYELSRRFAALKVTKDEVDDVVQDIALHALIKLRRGIWKYAPDNVHAFTWKLVKNHVADRIRRKERRVESEMQYARVRDDRTPQWMSPDRSHDEEVISNFQRRIVGELPRRCREVYVLVREEGMTVPEAALLLDISQETVHTQMAIARRMLSKKLRRHGWPSRREWAESATEMKAPTDETPHFRPPYPAPATKTIAPDAEMIAAGG